MGTSASITDAAKLRLTTNRRPETMGCSSSSFGWILCQMDLPDAKP
jgi:hypothetical protein